MYYIFNIVEKYWADMYHSTIVHTLPMVSYLLRHAATPLLCCLTCQQWSSSPLLMKWSQLTSKWRTFRDIGLIWAHASMFQRIDCHVIVQTPQATIGVPYRPPAWAVGCNHFNFSASRLSASNFSARSARKWEDMSSSSKEMSLFSSLVI